MQASAGLVVGSYTRNEVTVIRRNGESADGKLPSPQQLNGRQVCQICGDDVGVAVVDGEMFVACNECAFPICRTCYEYERREGNQVCPRCKTRFRRLKGCARVVGDEEEDDIDDLENEFDFDGNNLNGKQFAKASLLGNGGSLDSLLLPQLQHLPPQLPLLNNGQMVDDARTIHPLTFSSHPAALLAKSSRPLDPSKDLAAYGYGSVAWKDRAMSWKQKQQNLLITETQNPHDDLDHHGDIGSVPNLPLADEWRQPLSRKLPIPSSLLNPYRLIIIIRLVVLGFFFHYRITNPVNDAYALWLVSVICEIWFALSWILDQFPKWHPIDRETYLERLSLRYEKEGLPSQLAPVDVFVTTVDPLKEPPLVTANTVLSVLAVDYPVDKVACYVSDDGAAMLTFEALSETSEFAKRWVPFCKKFCIEPRAPESYFAQKADYLKDRVVQVLFVKERRAMKREYEDFKVRINALIANAQKVPEDGWPMQDGTPWPGNNVRDHPGMIQVLLGQSGGHDAEGNEELPRLIYVSREKRPGFNHHKKAGAMNALVRVSAVLTNSTYILNLDCDHYINNSKAIREAMCFMMDPLLGKRVCYVQFPQRFDGIDQHDRYANCSTLFFDINMKGLDGIQGPIYVGTGCVFRRQALYGYDAPKTKKMATKMCSCCGCCYSGRRKKKTGKWMSEMESRNSGTSSPVCALDGIEESGRLVGTREKKMEKKFGESPVFIASMLQEDGGAFKSECPASSVKEAVHVISCGYEDKTEWGKDVGWIYGSVTEDILTGFKMHCRGWRSIYCMPVRPAFKGCVPINLADGLHQVLRRALGSVEILLSRHCPLWYGYGGGLKGLERLSYISAIVYPFTCIPLTAYSALPAVCLLTGKFITPELSNPASYWFISVFICIFGTSVMEMRWSGVGMDEWWRNEQFWVIGGVSAHLFAIFQGLLKATVGVNTNFTVTSKAGDLYAFKWTTLLIPPTALLLVNIIGVVAGVSKAVNNGYGSWGLLFGKLFFALWVIIHLYPLLKGLMGRQNRTPTIVMVWSVLLASIFSFLWVRMDPFIAKLDEPVLEECGLDCN